MDSFIPLSLSLSVCLSLPYIYTQRLIASDAPPLFPVWDVRLQTTDDRIRNFVKSKEKRNNTLSFIPVNLSVSFFFFFVPISKYSTPTHQANITSYKDGADIGTPSPKDNKEQIAIEFWDQNNCDSFKIFVFFLLSRTSQALTVRLITVFRYTDAHSNASFLFLSITQRAVILEERGKEKSINAFTAPVILNMETLHILSKYHSVCVIFGASKKKTHECFTGCTIFFSLSLFLQREGNNLCNIHSLAFLGFTRKNSVQNNKITPMLAVQTDIRQRKKTAGQWESIVKGKMLKNKRDKENEVARQDGSFRRTVHLLSQAEPKRRPAGV